MSFPLGAGDLAAHVAMVGDLLALRIDGPQGAVGLLFEPGGPPSGLVGRSAPLVRGEVRPPLVWSPSARALVTFFGATSRAASSAPRAGQAARARARFYGEAPSAAFAVTLPPVNLGAWRELGEARRVDYESDKWGRGPTGYKHDHGPGVRAFLAGDFRSGVLVLRGGRLALTRRGIVG